MAIEQAPWFGDTDLLVTEKGVIFDLSSTIGNQLTRASLSMDLNDPNACLLIQAGAEEKLWQEGEI